MIPNIKKNPFLINIITLISGTAISQGILFAATPLLTRLYTPEDFGYFSLYAAIVAVITSVASWKYELAIMLPKEEKDAQAILFLSIITTLISTLFVLLLIILFKNFIIQYLTSEVETFIWIVPLGVLISGLYQVFISYSSRNKYFRSVSASRISQSGGAVSVQVGAKGFDLFPQGLIWGKLAGDFLALVVLLFKYLKNQTIQLKAITRKDIQANAIKYKDFPKYQSLAQFLSSLSQNVPFFLLTTLYNPEIAGFYMLTSRILSVPTALIGRSTREVYYQKASEMYASGKNIFDLYYKTTLGLARIGIIPFIIFGFFATLLFVWIFGEEWYTSGVYAQIILLWTFFLFINPPTTTNIYILNLQKFRLKFEIVSVLLRITGLLAGFYFFHDHFISVGLFALAGVLLNLYLILYIYRKLKGHE